MNKIYFILLATILAFSVEGRVFRIIDDFLDPPYLARFVPPASEAYDTTPPYQWFSPYSNPVPSLPGTPFTNFRNVANVIGGQRDIIIGHFSSIPSRSSISCTVNAVSGLTPANFQLSLPTGFRGGIYLQYDGIDDTVSASVGALLGKTIGGDLGAGSNADGTVDFTFGGQARGIQISVQTDLPIAYELKAVSLTDNTATENVGNRLDLVVQRNEISGFTRFYFTFNDGDWSNAAFDWTRVAGFQVKVFTGSAGTLLSLDSRIFLIQIGTLLVGGNVRADCLCDNRDFAPLSGIRVNLFDLSISSSVANRTTTTDSNGDYFFNQFTSFSGVISATTPYRICLDDPLLVRCPGTLPNSANGCYDFFTTDAFVDQLDFDFTIQRSTTFTIPDDLDFECDSQSTLPPTTGNAVLTDCDGSVITVTTFGDTITGNTCITTIARRWVNPVGGASLVQTIRVRDTTRPTFATAPTSITVDCASPSVTMNAWVNTRFADSLGQDDCGTTTIINNWDTVPVSGCGAKTVNFTVRDQCGLLSDPLPATYTVTDNADPNITTQAQDLDLECNLKVPAQNANTRITAWLVSNGNAIASDTCTTASQLRWSEDFSDTSITSGNACDFEELVTFTVTDNCGRSATTAATVTVFDSVGPRITRAAQPQTTQCATDGSNNVAFIAWVDRHADAIATDDCVTNDNTLLWSDDYTGGVVGGSCTGAVTVTFTVTDGCGLSTSTTGTFTITDTTPPVITTGASAANPTCDGNGNAADWAAFLSSRGGAVASDNCGAITWDDNSPATPPTSCGASATVTFRAFQQCSPALFAATTATYTIRDQVAPIFTTNPISQVVECGPTAPATFISWLTNNAGAAISDTCSNIGTSISNNFVSSNLQNGCRNIATVTFTGQDGCGNRNTGLTASFTIQDTQDPVISGGTPRTEIDCNISTNQQQFTAWRNSQAGATASDCLAVTWTFNDTAPIGNGCNSERFVLFTASDPCQNSASFVASFVVVDDQPPVITRQASPGSFECDGNDNQSDIANFLRTNGGATATDNCGAVEWTNNFVSLNNACDQTTTVTFTATDPCNLVSTTSTTLTIRDSSPPIISPRASDSIVDCNTETNANDFQAFLNNRGGARATDLCQSSSTLVWTNNQTSSPVGCNSVIVQFTVTDACNQAASTSARFTIIDDDGPTITQNPSSISVECNGSGNTADYSSWVSSRGGATAVDACATSLTWTNNAPASGPRGCGVVPVVFTVSDQCNNAVSVTASFTVIDSNPPAILTPAQNVTVPCDGRSNNGDLETWILNHGNAVAQDTCYSSDSLLWRNDFIGLSSRDRCTQYVDVVFQVFDGCGQRAQTVATYTITDNTPPVITRQAENRDYECNDITNQDDINNWILVNGAANAIDTCTEIEWTNDFDLVYPVECQGPKVVTFTASDLCGLSASTTATVQIVDTIVPVFLNFPRDITVTCADPTDPAWTRSPDVFDSYCDNELEATYSDFILQEPDDRLCPGDFIITRTWFLIDDCGNGISRNQTIIVTLPDGPCTFTQCPPCDETKLCCESSLEPVPCSPVPCNPVGCAQVDCSVVPCLPKVCGSASVPIYDDDDGPIFTSPIPVADSVTCEPIYVYVFDDDENNAEPVESVNSSSFIVASFTLILSIFFLMI